MRLLQGMSKTCEARSCAQYQNSFPPEHAPDALAYWGLTDGDLEVTIEGWLRSTPSGDGGPPVAVVVVDRVLYLTVTDAMRELVGRHKASSGSGKPAGNRGAAQRAG